MKKYLISSLIFINLVITNLLYAEVSDKDKKFIIIYPQEGVGSARLMMNDRDAINLLKMKPVVSGKDTEYEGQTVYYYYFGEKDKYGNFSLEIYSDVKRKIFMFVINSSGFATSEGIRVGSLEQELWKTYSKNLKKKKQGDIYLKYTLGTKKGTDFYVRNGVVSQIIVRSY